MTTIAIKDGVMACDSRETQNNMIVSDKTWKIALANDAYYGFCGTSHHIEVVITAIRSSRDLEELSPDVEMEFLYMPKTGDSKLVTLGSGHLSYETLTGPYAIGSGMPYAMVAMSCGKSAVEAVKEAIKWDCFSGGKVKSYSFNKPKAAKKVKKPKAVDVGVFDDWEEGMDDKA